MKYILIFLMFLVASYCGIAQDKSASGEFDNALEHPEFVYEFIFDETWLEVPKTISTLVELQTLIFDHTQVEVLPKEIWQLPKLQRLVFVNTPRLNIDAIFNNVHVSNSLEMLAFDTVQMDQVLVGRRVLGLRHLYMDNAGMKSLTIQIDSFPNLEILSIAGNPGCVVPREVAKLTKLKTLVLSGCRIDTLPASVLSIPALEGLILDNNGSLRIDAVASQLLLLARIKVLSLSNCNIESLPRELCRLAELENLIISNNQLTCLPIWIGCWNRLNRLDAAANQIDRIPEALWMMHDLEYVDLSNNAISSIFAIDVKAPLIQLLLKGNPLDQSTLERLDRWYPGWIDVLH